VARATQLQLLIRCGCAIAVLAGVCLCGCDRTSASASAAAPSAAVDSSAVIGVDAAHRMLNSHYPSTPYLAAAGEKLIIHANNYSFSDAQHQPRTPSVLRVLYNKSEYVTAWSRSGCELNPATLRVVNGSAFKGFEPGKQAFVGVGVESVDPKSGAVSFHEYWVASVLFH
jgi:hypothetical protein